MIAHFYPRETSEISKTFDTFSYFLTGQYFFTVGGLWSAYAPSLSQAQRIKKLSQAGKCSYDAIFDIMGEEKKAEMDRVTIKNDVLRKYFPKSYTPRQMEETILKLLEQWQKKRQRSQER